MTIEADIAAVLSTAGIKAFHKAAPQHATTPFTVYTESENDALGTLAGYGGLTRHDYTFQSWGGNAQSAISMRDAVAAAIDAADELQPYRLPGGESAFDDATNEHMAPCAFSLWARDG